MNIKPGKWRMRNGECAVVEFRTEAKVYFPWIGYDQMTHTRICWSDEGRLLHWDTIAQSQFDLIEPWTDKPVVDWSAMPAWAKWVAIEHNGVAWWFSHKPSAILGRWVAADGYWGEIPNQCRPALVGNWMDSLVERPSA